MKENMLKKLVGDFATELDEWMPWFPELSFPNLKGKTYCLHCANGQGNDRRLDMPPRYKHDCDACRFIGQHNEFDVYHCAQCDGGTIVARFSDEPSGYASMTQDIIASWISTGYEPSKAGKALVWGYLNIIA
jgi:hypothetical protein